MQPSAQIAISILEKLQVNTSPAILAYWVTPNTVLTLSGARAYCDGVFYDNNKSVLEEWVSELNVSLQYIQSATDVYFAEAKVDKTSSGEAYAGYDVIMGEGLKYVLKQTNMLPDRSNKLYVKHLSGEKLVTEMAAQLKSQLITKDYTEDNLKDAAFGILVGYPDKAIIGSVGEWGKNDPFSEPLIEADIRGASYYLCPQPIYSYPRHLINDQEIKTNEKQWSAILREFYTSNFHSRLAGNPQFKRKAKQLGLYP